MLCIFSCLFWRIARVLGEVEGEGGVVFPVPVSIRNVGRVEDGGEFIGSESIVWIIWGLTVGESVFRGGATGGGGSFQECVAYNVQYSDN